MKITGKKNIEAERLRGRAAVDAVYIPKINAAMGPKFALYQLKALVAAENDSLFGDPDIILTKHAGLIAEVSMIENQRQMAQAKIDAAKSAAEIDAIIAAL